jgi:hypothetical protein
VQASVSSVDSLLNAEGAMVMLRDPRDAVGFDEWNFGKAVEVPRESASRCVRGKVWC